MASSNPTTLHTPEGAPYPIKITKLLVKPDDNITRGAPLCSYTYSYKLPNGVDIRYGTWESPVEGVFGKWFVRPGDIIASRPDALKDPAATVIEPCPHDTQVHGMCAICGKDMTEIDYLGATDASRASIRMTHEADGPTVSLSVAKRLDQENSQRLLQARKLSLIVDLDQTIVHATVDPTVGEWMNDAERHATHKAAREAAKLIKGNEDVQLNGNDDVDMHSDTLELESPISADDDVNPNWAALSDVKRFKLGEGQPSGGFRPHDDGCFYYIKPRPGLFDFLHQLKSKYEMHVYTMGTRAYALEVCKAIDPDQTLFGNRVLTRDESGSMTSKNLQRLFPSDQSMVVVIDDRSDVWADVPNLVKVIPYDFFVGIGDINSSHLPSLAPLPGSMHPSTLSTPGSSLSSALSSSPSPTLTPSSGSSSPTTPVSSDVDIIQSSPEEESAASAMSDSIQEQEKALSRAQSLVIEHVKEDRPLAKMQEQLDHEDEIEVDGEGSGTEGVNGVPGGLNGSAASASMTNSPTSSTSKPQSKHRMLLHNNDHELVRVGGILLEAHRQFYDAYDRSNKKLPRKVDVRNFVEGLKQQTFKGLHFTFSNIIPINMDAKLHQIWRQSERFGARCHPLWNDSITHVVALKLHSQKTEHGQLKPGVHVLHPQWVWDSIAQWHRVPEDVYVSMLGDLDAAEMRALSSRVGGLGIASGSGSSTSIVASSSPGSIPGMVPSWEGQTIPEGETFSADADGEVDAQGDEDIDLDLDVDVNAIDWGSMNKEVDDFMDDLDSEDDDEDEDDSDENGGSSQRSKKSNPSTPRGAASTKRKRTRSGSVNSAGSRDVSPSPSGNSPLSKRPKTAKDSQLAPIPKVAIYKGDSLLPEEDDDDTSNRNKYAAFEDGGGIDDDDDASERRARHEEQEEEEENMRDATDDEDGEDEDEDDDDDFLARDLGKG